MANELVTIEGNDRKETGKSFCRKLRVRGKVPAVILDKGKSIHIELDPKWLGKACKTGNRQFNLKLNGTERKVAIKEMQFHVVSRKPLHFDLVYV